MSFQVPTATSQQMDDLFDILIESGGKLVHTDGAKKNVLFSVKKFKKPQVSEKRGISCCVGRFELIVADLISAFWILCITETTYRVNCRLPKGVTFTQVIWKCEFDFFCIDES